MELAQRPISILIAALGGEGGGVLADWIVAAATASDYPVQSTSIPGVAQRTGATTYYVELFPRRAGELEGRHPVMTLTPAPADIDVMLASELLEAGRALLNGYVTPERTTLIASTHRIYTVEEKLSMGDGRYDSARIVAAAEALAKRAILVDFHKLAAGTGAMINAALFGALAGSGTLPLSRAACEEAIRSAGKGAEASLRGFALGFSAASADSKAQIPAWTARAPVVPEQSDSSAKLAPELAERVHRTFPKEAHAILEQGAARVADFHDRAYAGLYLDRLETIARRERELPGSEPWQLTRETARFLALWMSYEDVIRVAELKSRRSRFERVRNEVQPKPGEPVHIIEYLKPGLEEAAALLPPALSRRLLAWTQKRGITHKFNIGMHVKSTSVTGFLLLRLLASLRPLRRLSARYAEEQVLIGRWLAAIVAAPNAELALEIALCGRLIKGYGDTNQRAKANFLRIIDTLVEGSAVADPAARAAAVRAAREGALADPDGRALEASLATRGIAPLPPKPKPVHFVRRAGANRKVA